jgi:hypothetical protein
MADFNISIPQPNTGAFGGNLLQGLSAIEGIKAARAQQALEQELAPLRLQQAELGIQSQRQQMAQSAAAAARAAFGFNQQLQALQAEKQRKTQVATAFNDFLKAEDAGVDAIAPAMGILNKDEFDKLQSAAQVRLAQIMGKMDPDNPQPELVKQFGQLSAMLPSAEGKRFDDIRNALPNKYREGLTSTLNDAALFGLAGENDKALKLMDDQIEAFGKDQNPAAQAMAKELQTVRSRLNEDTKPAIWANSFYGNALRSRDPKTAEAALNFLKERGPEQLDKTKAETMKAEAAAKLDLAKAEGGVDVKELPMGLQKIVNEGADNSETFTNLADKANSLATSLEGMRDKLGGGVFGRAKQAAKAGFGAQDEVSAAIKATEALLNEDALARFKKVTSGAISDRETRTALGANPSVYGNPENTIEYLRALSNGAARAAKYEEAKSDWVSKFGTLTAAKQDTSIGDLSVKKGETFSEFRKRLAADLGRKKFYGAGSIDEQNNAERAKESRKVQEGPGPDFTGNEQDSLLRAAEVLRRLKTQ